MPITIAKLKDVPSEVPVSYNGETAMVAYNKNAVSNKEWREIRNRSRRAAADGAPISDDAENDFKVAILSRLVVSWDVMDGKKPYPHTKEALDDLPPQFLGAVLDAVVDDIFPNPTPAPSTGSFS